MASPSVIASNAQSKDSRVFFTNFRGAYLRVASSTMTTVVTDDTQTLLTGTGLYAASTPGQLMVIESAAGTTHHFKVADVTGITTNTLTVDTDLSTALADGDIVAVVPPLACEAFLRGGTTLQDTTTYDEEVGVGQVFKTQNTLQSVSVAGDIPIFGTGSSEAMMRILLAGFGSHKVASTLHSYVPIKSNDGTYTDNEELTVFTRDGNSAIQQVWFGLRATQLVVDLQANGSVNPSLSVVGNGVIKELPGVAGKIFTLGANNYVPAAASGNPDTGARFQGHGTFMELGGSFGDGLTDSRDKFFTNAQITISHPRTQDPVLGHPFPTLAQEQDVLVTVTGTRILQDDDLTERHRGGSTEPFFSNPTETRLLIKSFLPGATARTLTWDMPRGVFKGAPITRQRGTLMQDFTYEALHTLSSGAIDTANPIIRCQFDSGLTTNVAAAL